MKKTITGIFIFLTMLFASLAFAADQAKQIDSLIPGYTDPTTEDPLENGYVLSYLDGTSTLSSLWTDKDKNGVAANPYPMNAVGQAVLFGDKIYKFEIYDGDPFNGGTLVKTLNGQNYKVSLLPDSEKSLNNDYACDLADAVSDIGAITQTTLTVDCDCVIDDGTAVTSTANIAINIPNGGSVDGVSGGGVETLNILGDFHADDKSFGANIVISGLKNTRPELWTVDGTADEVQIQKAEAAGTGTLTLSQDYVCSAPVTISSPIEIEGVNNASITMSSPYAYIFNIALNVDGVEIHGVDFDGGLSANNDTLPIGINSSVACANVKIYDCEFENLAYGVGLVSATHVKVYKNQFGTMYRNIAKNQGGHGIVFNACNDVETHGNKIDGPPRHGIYLAYSGIGVNDQVRIYSEDITMPFDGVSEPFSSGIELYGFENVTIDNVDITGGYNANINITPGNLNQESVKIDESRLSGGVTAVRMGALDPATPITYLESIIIANTRMAVKAGESNFIPIALRNFQYANISNCLLFAEGGANSLGVFADNTEQGAATGIVNISNNQYFGFIGVGRNINCTAFVEKGAIYTKSVAGTPVFYVGNCESYDFTSTDVTLYTLNESSNGVAAIVYRDDFLFSQTTYWHPYYNYWVHSNGLRIYGTTAQRPTGSIPTNYVYYDTDVGARIDWDGAAWGVF